MIKRSKDNNDLGRKLENKAKEFLDEATNAFDLLNSERDSMQGL